MPKRLTQDAHKTPTRRPKNATRTPKKRHQDANKTTKGRPYETHRMPTGGPQNTLRTSTRQPQDTHRTPKGHPQEDAMILPGRHQDATRTPPRTPPGRHHNTHRMPARCPQAAYRPHITILLAKIDESIGFLPMCWKKNGKYESEEAVSEMYSLSTETWILDEKIVLTVLLHWGSA